MIPKTGPGKVLPHGMIHTANGYQDTSVYGVLTLTGKPGQSDEGGNSNSNNNNSNSSNGSAPQTGNVENKDGVVTIKPEVKTEGKGAKAAISGDHLKKALDQAAPAANGRKQIIVEVQKQANVFS